MQSKDEILKWVVEIFAREFGFSMADLRPETRLAEDLDLDSIDAIDLAVGLREQTGLDLSEEELKSIRIVGDIVDLLRNKLPDA